MYIDESIGPLVFVDLETTGANFANDRIIEIGLVKVSQHEVYEWSSLVNPERPVSSFITGLTGIDSSMVESAPRFEQIADDVLENLRGCLFVAHNARFDYSFLKREFKRLGLEFRATNLCTVKLSRKLFPEHHRHSLEALVARYNIPVTGRHRALADARVLWELWQRWHQLLAPEIIRERLDAIIGKPELPPQLDATVIDDLPEAPGAYAIFDDTGAVLQLKRSANIRLQILAQFTPASRDTALVKNAFRIDWRESAGELGARLFELELSAHSRKSLSELCSWQLVEHAKGDFRPQLIFARENDFSSEKNLFGLYMNRREAVQALRKLVEAHRLCHKQTGLFPEKDGESCIGYKQKTCRGACIGKELISLHSARLMSALAKFKISDWPFAGAVALIERDEFGMREDFHVFKDWRYLGSAQNETALNDLLERGATGGFDPDIYRLINKFLRAEKVRVDPLTQKIGELPPLL